MDISQTTEPRSDQQNFDDYVAGPRIVTISEVTRGSAEQPVEIHLAEYPGRPWKPSKSMRRVLVAAWGAEASTYTGRRVKLFGDPDVRFGGQRVGGIRIAALSDIDSQLSIPLTVTRGKRAPYIVEPLPVDAIQSKIPVDIEARIEAMADPDKLTAMIDWLGKLTGEDEHRVAELVDLVHTRIAAVEPSADDAQQTIQQELGAEEVQP